MYVDEEYMGAYVFTGEELQSGDAERMNSVYLEAGRAQGDAAADRRRQVHLPRSCWNSKLLEQKPGVCGAARSRARRAMLSAGESAVAEGCERSDGRRERAPVLESGMTGARIRMNYMRVESTNEEIVSVEGEAAASEEVRSGDDHG